MCVFVSVCCRVSAFREGGTTETLHIKQLGVAGLSDVIESNKI